MRRCLLVILAFGCGGPPQLAGAPGAGAQDAKRQADKGVVETATPEAAATAPQAIACGDTVLVDQIESGGEQLSRIVPCTNVQPPVTAQPPLPRPEPDPSEAVPLPPIATEPPAVPSPPKKKATSSGRARTRR